MRFTLLTILGIFLASCAQIESYEEINVQVGKLTRISIGEELFRIRKSRDLPNVFGRADVYGGKIDEGFSELRFLGLNESGEIVFRYTDIDIESNETVFTRYGGRRANVHTMSTGNATLVGNSVYGNSSSTTTVTMSEPPKPTITQLPPGAVEFAFDPEEGVLEIADYSVEILEVQAYGLVFRLTPLEEL